MMKQDASNRPKTAISAALHRVKQTAKTRRSSNETLAEYLLIIGRIQVFRSLQRHICAWQLPLDRSSFLVSGRARP